MYISLPVSLAKATHTSHGTPAPSLVETSPVDTPLPLSKVQPVQKLSAGTVRSDQFEVRLPLVS